MPDTTTIDVPAIARAINDLPDPWPVVVWVVLTVLLLAAIGAVFAVLRWLLETLVEAVDEAITRLGRAIWAIVTLPFRALAKLVKAVAEQLTGLAADLRDSTVRVLTWPFRALWRTVTARVRRTFSGFGDHEQQKEGGQHQQQREQRRAAPPAPGQGMSYDTAVEILELKGKADFTFDELKKQYRSIVSKVHPDKGGHEFFTRQTIEAYEMIKASKGW